VEPASWTNANRTSVQLVVIHDTEGSSQSESAEDGAAYDARRTDGTSTHYFHDNNSTVQCVLTADQAHTARTQGNRRGIHHELCAKASFSRSKWLSEDYGLPMLRRAAKQVARDCKKWGIPVRKLTPGQVADGVKGICGHVDITKAFPQDNGTHTDPGPNFPWDTFIDMVRDIVSPPKEPRVVKIQYFNAHLPVIPKGHDDADGIVGEDGQLDDTAYVKRIQTLLNLVKGAGLTVDGDYGDATAAAVKSLGISGRDGSYVDLEVWERLDALWGAVLTSTATPTAKKS
jgi:hypothetical protein